MIDWHRHLIFHKQIFKTIRLRAGCWAPHHVRKMRRTMRIGWNTAARDTHPYSSNEIFDAVYDLDIYMKEIDESTARKPPSTVLVTMCDAERTKWKMYWCHWNGKKDERGLLKLRAPNWRRVCEFISSFSLICDLNVAAHRHPDMRTLQIDQIHDRSAMIYTTQI